jgi:hypothetical protein|tara:strand:- start:116 stop:454 length:339 start_codon:yes stop_codon:yes gene_type:complete
MFSSKIIVSTLIFLIFLVVTSIVKNQTRIIEKKLYKLSKKISLLEREINESQFDFSFLTSPAELDKKLEVIDYNNYVPIKNSKIFLSPNSFTKIKDKISVFNNPDEKKTKKN